MAQRFTGLDEAAEQLGISKDRLNQLREAGKVRAYRDGASWKFRTEDIDKLSSEGIPSLDPSASDLSLDLDDEPPAPPAEPTSPEPSGLELELADEEPAPEPAASDISLEDVDEPTVAGIDEASDDELALDLGSESIDMSDSILLSDTELGESTGRPPSTIIGKNELDADLDLAPAEAGPASDVRLAGESDILPGAGDDDEIGLELPSPSGDFEGLEELEVDLEAESSRILSAEDVSKAQQAAAQKQEAEVSDLELAPSDSGPGVTTSDVGIGSEAGTGTGLTGLSALELDDDDDEVLGEGSDVTLSGESSGINLISPSDSGLALDEVSLDLGGSSPIGSSLDLGSGVDEEATLEPLMVGEGLEEPQAGEDFQLTPLGEEGAEDEERDSSQVIALDEISEEASAEPLGVGVGESGMLGEEDFGSVGLTPGAAPVGVVSAQETPFSLANVLGLASCLLLLSLCGMMTYDLLRNIWSWDGVTSLNSSLMESVLNPFL